MNIQVSTEFEVRLSAAAEDREMSVEEFVFDALERALRPIENRRLGSARDVVELEALWRGSSEPDSRHLGDDPLRRD